MTVSITECPGCHYKFNYEFILGGSFHSIRLGTKRIFRCPKCRELHKFSITNFGSDPTLPTHGDNAETGIGTKIWVLMLVPTLSLCIFGAFLPLFGGSRSLSYFFIPIVAGAVWISFYSVYLIRGRRAKSIRQTFIIILIIGVVIIGLGIGLSYSSRASSTITVGNGYMYNQSPSFGGTGNMNITSSQIQSAYVGQVGAGNLTISKQHGTNTGNFNVGVFTLGKGATAYVVSDNSTSLVKLYSGKYWILGTNNTSSLVAAFSNSVHSVQNATLHS